MEVGGVLKKQSSLYSLSVQVKTNWNANTKESDPFGSVRNVIASIASKNASLLCGASLTILLCNGSLQQASDDGI